LLKRPGIILTGNSGRDAEVHIKVSLYTHSVQPSASGAGHTVKGDKAWLCVEKMDLWDEHQIKSPL